ncbi:polysaccharide deacetylase family protein [Alicyclobacillus dauci]|uniref:Polysaccharide deacetylase family protein n=1 Tax=Alicyclobacillus dauci TaxID=1475485 RepID=A0ABY6Z7B7_9BACL|nr:polysaccharide deacetylase family protein [Alicyclobacillus dauci]WAH38798.1 polysaccharide deacetylase family protein [Alicyclobacillus dauci]
MSWWMLAVAIMLILFIYSGWPVIWTRVFHRSCIRLTNRPNSVSLTFDDGPDPAYTPRLLDVLKEHNVHASFFVLARKAREHPEIIKRMLDEGHDVQIHGFQHWFVPLLHPVATYEQCLGAAKALSARFGTVPLVYRPTWGACNLITLLIMRFSRMRLCTWSVMVGDWRRTEPTELVRRIEKKLGDGSIIVLHDSNDTFGAEDGAADRVILAIPAIVDLVRRKGYHFIRISECV